MSNVDSEQQPKNLEDALQEIDNLRSQLSGSDLKVFTQNRELKIENQKLKEEIRQLTEQCVAQTFKVRGLEKSEQKLQGELASAQSHGVKLEERVKELESQVTDLGGQLDEFRSKEIHLSQELDRVVATNKEELERLMTEHSQEFEVRQAEYQKSVQELEQQVAEREGAIKNLESKVEQFKEEFLSQELTSVADFAPSTAPAFELLSSKMESFLGFPGKALVEQVFRLSGVDPSSSNPSELEETFEVLQDTASQLVRSPEQEQELASILKSVWHEIETGESTTPAAQPVAATPDTAPEPTVEEAPEPTAEVEAEVSPEATTESAPEAPEVESEPAETVDQAESKPETTEDPLTEEPTETESQAEVEVEEAGSSPEEDPVAPVDALEPQGSTEEAEPEIAETNETASEQESPIAESPVPVETPPVTEEPSETVPEPEPEQATEEEAESQPQEVAEEENAETDSDHSAESAAGSGPDFETAAAYLEEGRHAEALPIFEALIEGDSEELTYQVGRLACLANLGSYEEAYRQGAPLRGHDLGESRDIFLESMETALVGLISSTTSDLAKKEYILELLQHAEPDADLQAYLDEADEIPLRIQREGDLALLQARHRVQQDDVTEYLIDALNFLPDRPDIFSLLKTNLERYPELKGLSDFLERLMDSSRAESLEAEVAVKELLGQGEAIEDLIDEVDPGEEAVVQVFLEHLIPRSEVAFDIPCEEFEELLLDAEPAAFVGSLRQALRSVDFTVFFDEIDVLSYDGEERFLLRSSPEPKPTLLFGAELDDVPPEELRFLVLRELFSMYRRHSQLSHISSGLDDQKRVELVQACIGIFSEVESKVSVDTQQRLDALKAEATSGGQDQALRGKLETFLRDVYMQTESDSFLELGDFLFGGQLNRKWLDPIADGFGAKQTGLVVASYAICRDQLDEDSFEQLEEHGFGWLYSAENLDKFHDLRLRLQRLWSTPLKALISEPEE